MNTRTSDEAKTLVHKKTQNYYHLMENLREYWAILTTSRKWKSGHLEDQPIRNYSPKMATCDDYHLSQLTKVSLIIQSV